MYWLILLVGKEMIQEVEQLQVDKKSRPLQDQCENTVCTG